MTACEQALLPWRTGFAFIAATDAVGSNGRRYGFVPFLEWFTAAGVSVRKRVVPPAQVLSTPCSALAESDGGYTFTGFGYDPAGPTNNTPDTYTLTRTDSLGTVLWSHVFAYPGQALQAVPYPNELLRTASGGYLITGFAGYLLPSVPRGYTNRPWLVETDAAGNLLRQATLPVFVPEVRASINRTFNNTLPLAGGARYVAAGQADSADGAAFRAWGFVTCFDTALAL
ncbi:hypothetical protein, partial [Hymenobacter agri]